MLDGACKNSTIYDGDLYVAYTYLTGSIYAASLSAIDNCGEEIEFLRQINLCKIRKVGKKTSEILKDGDTGCVELNQMDEK